MLRQAKHQCTQQRRIQLLQQQHRISQQPRFRPLLEALWRRWPLAILHLHLPSLLARLSQPLVRKWNFALHSYVDVSCYIAEIQWCDFIEICLVKYAIFTRESSYCFQRVLAIAILSVRPSVCPSVTRVDQSKTVQARITKSSPSAAWKTLVSETVKLFYKFEGGHPEQEH